MLETYDETSIFILVDITEDTVKAVARKLSWSYGHVGMYLEALQGRILRFGGDHKRLLTSVEIIFEWLAGNY